MLRTADKVKSGFDGDFIAKAKRCLNDTLRSRLRNLKNFQLQNVEGFNEDRLHILNLVLQRQIRKVLGEVTI